MRRTILVFAAMAVMAMMLAAMAMPAFASNTIRPPNDLGWTHPISIENDPDMNSAPEGQGAKGQGASVVPKKCFPEDGVCVHLTDPPGDDKGNWTEVETPATPRN